MRSTGKSLILDLAEVLLPSNGLIPPEADAKASLERNDSWQPVLNSFEDDSFGICMVCKMPVETEEYKIMEKKVRGGR